MSPGAKRALGVLALLVLFFGMRLPALLLHAPTADEWAWIGAGRALLQDGPATVAALEYAPPLVAHLTSIPTWFLTEDPDAALLTDAPAALALYRSWWIGTGTTADAWLVLLLVRLPVLLVGLFGMEMLRRAGKRIFDEGTGWIAAAAWALHPGLAGFGVRATPDVVAAVAGLFLFVSFVDYHDVSARRGRTASLRALRLGLAVALALAARHVMLLPVVVLALAGPWLRAKRRARGEDVLDGALARFARMTAIAVLVFWALFRFELGPLTGDTLPSPAAGLGDLLGIDSGSIQGTLARTTLPCATYVQSLLIRVVGPGHVDPIGSVVPGGYLLETVLATPLVLLALLAAGLVGWRRLRKDRADLPDLVLVLAVALFVAPALFGPALGPEHALPALPFLFLLGGAALRRFALARPGVASTVLAVAGALLVLEVAPQAFDPAAHRNVLAGAGPEASPDEPVPPPGARDQGQDLWRVLDWGEGRGVEDLITATGAPDDVLAYEARSWPFLWSPTAGTSGLAGLASSIRAEDQPDGTDERRLLAISEDALRHPALAPLRDVEPMHTIGRTRLYRLPPPPKPADGLPAGAIPEDSREPK